MAKTTKRMQAAFDGIDREKLYTVEEAVKALKERSKGIFVGVVLLAFYLLLYLLLRVEDYALLIGSLSGFGFLATLMYMTRNVDWSGYGGDKQPDDLA